MGTSSAITSDARERHLAAIRNEVAVEFADSLKSASFWHRFRIRLVMRAETRRRIKQQASGRNLYSFH
jgi:hypothetical protein